jgi:hypothetical protein
MPLAPPTYGTREYWDQRFSKDSNPFEWLSAPDSLDPFITDALRNAVDPEPEILHIGCGSSLLSYHLRAHVTSPKQIHNVDYSKIAVDIGRQREVDLYTTFEHCAEEVIDTCEESKEKVSTKDREASSKIGSGQEEHKDKGVPANGEVPSDAPFMRWDATDLLKLPSLLGACKPSSYSVVVDKSTSDCIACVDDVEIPLPYHLSYGPEMPPVHGLGQTSLTYPVQLMAVHLALVTKPGARWISLSYSADRYYFLDDAPANKIMSVEQEVPDGALPDVRLLWRVLGKYELEASETQAPSGGRASGSVVHTPKVYHWVHVLERTEMPVVMRREWT